MLRRYVIAGSYAEYRDWCFRHNVPNGHAVYVTNAVRLQGMRLNRNQVTFTGNWASRPDQADLVRAAHDAFNYPN